MFINKTFLLITKMFKQKLSLNSNGQVLVASTPKIANTQEYLFKLNVNIYT